MDIEAVGRSTEERARSMTRAWSMERTRTSVEKLRHDVFDIRSS